MDAETLKAVGMVAGIGGVALAVLMTIFRDVIQKNIFPSLSPDAAYRLLRLVLVLTWSVALIGVIAWVMSKRIEHPGPAAPAKTAFNVVGLITDGDDNGIVDANVSIIGTNTFVRSDSTGAFTLTAWLGDERDVLLRITKDGFRPRSEKVHLPASNLALRLERAVAATPPGADAVPAAVPAAIVDKPPAHVDVASGERGAVSLAYLGDQYGCVLNLQVRLGDRSYQPTANPYVAGDVQLGAVDYGVQGAVNCPMPLGSCAAGGAGRLMLRSGGVYNVVWQNVGPGQCQVALTPAG